MPEPTMAELMSRRVITVGPDAGFKELAAVMITHELSAVPVIDATGCPLGVVTERDLLTKLEFHGGTDTAPLLVGSACRTRWRKSSALIAADLMTAPAITAADTRAGVAAHTMVSQHLCVLCVVDGDGRLIGVITRADLIRLFLRCDDAIQAEVERDLADAARPPHQVTVYVAEGIVTLEGTLTLHSATARAGRIAHHVPGVLAVHNNIRYDVDDQMITGM